jgi:solute carrier family 35 protein C2
VVSLLRYDLCTLMLMGGRCACCRYIFATILSVYNKWMFTPEYYNFPYPLFVTMIHQIVQFGLAFAIRRIWPSLRPKEKPNRSDYS